MKVIRVAAIQFRIEIESSRERILERAKKLIGEAAKEEVQIVCLPERWNYRKGNVEDNLEPVNGPTMGFLEKISEEYGIYLIGGAIWVFNENKTENHIIAGIFNPKGEILSIQQKLHLYLYEKSFFSPGKNLNVVDTELGKIGVAICFDMTFPEVARFYALEGVDLIFSPVLIRDDGIENWHIYLKARALENRMPICAVNCVGGFNDKKFPGQSLIIDFKKGHETPSKLQVREGVPYKEQVLIATVDLATARKLRKKRLAERLEIDNRILGKNKK